MNKKENWLCAIEGKACEWIPASFWKHLKPNELEGEACVESHVRFLEETGVDVLKIMHDGMEAPINLRPRNIDELSEFRPKRLGNPYVCSYLERAGRITERVGEEVYTYCNIFSPFTLLRRMGDEKLLSYIKNDKQLILSVLEFLAEEIGWMAQQMVWHEGCLGCFVAFQGAESNLFTESEFREIVGPSDQILLNMVNEASSHNILHFCAWNGVKNHVGGWRKYSGAMVNWATYVEDMNLQQGKAFFHMRPVMGGFDNRKTGLLYNGTKEEIQSETKRLIKDYKEAFGNTNGLVLGADCSFLTDFSPDRFRYVIEILQEVR